MGGEPASRIQERVWGARITVAHHRVREIRDVREPRTRVCEREVAVRGIPFAGPGASAQALLELFDAFCR